MTPVETIVETVGQVVEAGPFAASWESLKQYEIPQWYEDGKFGIFIHWGVYCVPAFGSEWYPRNMYQQGTKEFEHHVATYGPHDQFGYKDFIPKLTAEKFDPTEWVQLFKEAGAKFIVPVAEHHDGFALYDTALSSWNSVAMGPKRDIIGELASAARDSGLVFGLSSHRAEHWWFFDGGKTFASDVQDPKFAGLYGPASAAPADWGNPESGDGPDEAFLDDWLARSCELVDKYRPQLVWFDWWIAHKAFKPYIQKFAAYYYNRGKEWGKGVAINYKYGAFEEGTAVFDIERGQLAGIRPLLWQNDTTVSHSSWGYVDNHNYKNTGAIIGDLVDIVSKNGALLLNVGPKADGTIPEPEQEMLRQIGKWLDINGEAIYGTRPWHIFGEGPTEVVEGAFTDDKRSAFTGEDIRFTTKVDSLYAIALAWPGLKLVVKSLALGAPLAAWEIDSVTLLGQDGALDYERTLEGLVVRMPAQPPCDNAYVLKITGLK